MNQFLRLIVVAALAFVLGLSVARVPFARAAAAPLQASAIDLMAIAPDAMPTSPAFPTLHQKMLVVADGMTAALAVGNAPRHYHADSNEIQVILDGSGTEWLGDHQVPLRPGTMVIIPAGVTHSGIVDASGGKLRLVAFKTPPQASTDIHLVP
jgi:mannose-6-phosphate isomerase-like protein (cupin superfamily)